MADSTHRIGEIFSSLTNSIQSLQDRLQILETQSETRLRALEAQFKVLEAKLQNGPPKVKMTTVIPYENRDASFEMFQTQQNGFDLSEVLQVAQKLVEEFSTTENLPSKALFFGGMTGIGKTTLAVAVANAMEAAGKSVLFTSAEGLFNKFIVGQGDLEFDAANVLIFDDFNGATMNIERSFLAEKIPRIHESGGKLVIVTSNMTFERFIEGSFPTSSCRYDKNGNLISEDHSTKNNTQRIARRLTELFGNRTFFFSH